MGSVYNCPNCGFETYQLKGNLECVGTGHSDVSWYCCPDCGDVSNNSSWVGPIDAPDRSPAEMQREISRLLRGEKR